jgi:2-polyprenyl-3-methyl-5-hydroxy-6-metoxy-1,4-benzoquinol methylase
MLEKILKNYSENQFDFRDFVSEEDELSYLFEEWVNYYKMKYAIVKALQPNSILEIGVRYGYSAITFLKAVPDAHYLGIDNDSDTFGGAKNAIIWARKITHEYDADFILEDTQTLDRLPGDHWDFIHIDGQQDGDGTFHDLELAIQKATWILVDGYFWSNENMFSATHFMKKYRQFIEYAIIIPGYAGDLLIKVRLPPRERGQTYLSLSSEYDKEYFEQDCGGYASFKRNQGKRLEDSRMIAPYLIAKPKPGLRILDIGCGRGELCYALAQSGADVTGIDYSADAINIARETFLDDDVKGSLSFFCGDVATFPFKDKFDVIIATDFVEHVETPVLEKILERCAERLDQNGRLVLHTAPNLQYYQQYYPQMRSKAKEAGCYLPLNPRSYYEDIMHINEQTPDSLKSLLSGVFNHFVIWVVPEGDMIGSLDSDFTEQMIASSRGIFAVASHDFLSKAMILSLLTQKPLDRSKVDVELKLSSQIEDMFAGQLCHLNLWIQNNGNERLASLMPYPVHIAYHWTDLDGNLIVFDGIRSLIMPSIEPLENRVVEIEIIPPHEPGVYILEISLVQESCFWFEEVIDELPYRLKCKVQ